MSQTAKWTRRDPRTELPPGTASVEFAWRGPDATPLRGDVASVSATGVAFVLEDDMGIESGATLTPAIIRLPGSIVRGDLCVRYTRLTDGQRDVEFGCLFYPTSLEDSARWLLFAEQRRDDARVPPQLLLRCSNCHSTVWICDTESSSHTCPHCRQEYDFEKPMSQSRLEDLHLQARGMALELEIDMPSAVSMLLGTLDLAAVRDILHDASLAEPVASTPAARKRHYDRAFQPAIDAGTLTETQAIQRGSREAYATKLVARHRIRLDDAYDVADNTISLLSLLRRREASRPIITQYRPPSRRTRIVSIASAAAVLLVAGIFLVRWFDGEVNRPAVEPRAQQAGPAVQPQTESAGAAAPASTISALPVDAYARVQTNEFGDVLSVEATDPGNVLVAFCKSQAPAGRLDPVDVVPTDPPSDEARLGVLRDLAGEPAYQVVVIRRNPQTRRWFLANAGNPEAGISMFPAPEWLVQTARERL